MSSVSRQRTVPPEDFTTVAILELPAAVRATMTGLRMVADDHGRGPAIPRLLWAAIWSLSAEISEDEMQMHLLALDEVGWLTLYDGGTARVYFQIRSWPKVDRPAPSQHPAPPPIRESLANHSRAAREPLANHSWRGEREESGETSGGGREWESVAGESGPPQDPTDGPDLLLGPRPFCPKHPEGTFARCGPCGTARMQHQLWVAAQRHTDPDPTDDPTRDFEEEP